MNVVPFYEEKLSSMDICGLNSKEIHQICELSDRLHHILLSHRPENKMKKEYVSDDELIKMLSILNTVAENVSVDDKESEFDKQEEKFRKELESYTPTEG